MIDPATTRLTVQRLQVRQIVATESQPRYPERVAHYVGLLAAHPTLDTGPVAVRPLAGHPGLYELLDGHHRFVAHIIVGRADLYAVVHCDRVEQE